MDRPKNLPDYKSPPLTEVVIGVQFGATKKYSSINSNGVWELFKAEFPDIQEHPQIDPQFETFGGVGQSGLNFKFGTPPLHNRLWFVSSDENHLLQFQDDRFLLNWRSVSGQEIYPRHEAVAQSFYDHFEKLGGYFSSKFDHVLKVTQAEISYINIIPVGALEEVGDWLSFFQVSSIQPEKISSNFTEVITDSQNNPVARMSYELQSAISNDGKKQKALRLVLSYRGAPAGEDIEAVKSFMASGRKMIVDRFTELTTREAHKSWERLE